MLTRRLSLFGLTAVLSGSSLRLALADLPTDRRLVAITLRGALDGLAAVVPYGDPALAGLRAALVPPNVGQPDGMLDLGGFYALHPLLTRLHAMFTAGEAAIIHAVSGPYHERSHFIAQDMLESGASQRLASGWLNRAVGSLQAGSIGRSPMAIGTSVPLLLRGAAPVENWAPSNLAAPQGDLYAAILQLSERDPIIGPAIRSGLGARGFSKATLASGDDDPRRMDFPSLAGTAGRLLAAPNGPRIAAMEIGGWDTHAAQTIRLTTPLRQLDEGLGALKTALGAAWKTTAVLVMTEFGRTARINGTGGSDHGTATVAFVVGGAVKGGRVIADWPGLGAGKLFEGRDLAPTRDLRSVTMALAIDHLGVPVGAMATVFPGAERVGKLGGLV